MSHSGPYLARHSDALRLRGIPAALLRGLGSDLTSHEERISVSAAVRSGKLRVLCLHSQFILDHTLISAIGEAVGGLRILIVDESTAVSRVSILPQYTVKCQYLLTWECDGLG